MDEVGSTESEGGFETGMIFGAWGMREKMTDGTTQNFGAGSLGAWGVREDDDDEDEDEDDSSDGEFRSLVFWSLVWKTTTKTKISGAWCERRGMMTTRATTENFEASSFGAWCG